VSSAQESLRDMSRAVGDDPTDMCRPWLSIDGQEEWLEAPLLGGEARRLAELTSSSFFLFNKEKSLGW
jgi:hypothetical protein